ncbi:ground-like domain-containing protein [Ditylenchus destructor]|uniref:Ground-like domain-containing protein n=1 Tax=Ditylenchus destructor TaxID=166010 RepID=A0AAD4NKS9_9BILA|nr:ground-like domain-containing protein [Ditylenchus destructor]
MVRSYLASCVFVLFASSAVDAIFFGGGGGGGGGCCQPSCCPPPPSCGCGPPPAPPQPCSCAAPPPPQPCSCAPPPPPPPSCSCAPPQPCGYSAPQQSCQPRYIIVRPIESSHSVGPVASGPVGGSYQAGPAISAPAQSSYAVAPAPISAPIQAPASYQAAPEIAAPAPPPPPPADTGSYRGTSYKSKARASKTILLDSRCNSGELRQVLVDNIIIDDANESKRRVHKAANEEFTTEESDKGIDVICAPSAFSYRIATDFFCEHTKGNVTCFAYQQHA